MDAWMRQHRLKFLLVGGQKLARDHESASLMSRRFEPCLQSKVDSLANSAHANEKHRKSTVLLAGPFTWSIDIFIVTINMPSQLLRRESPVQKGFSCKRGWAQQA